MCNHTFDMYFLKSFEIQSHFSVQNVFKDDFTTLDAIKSPIRALNPLGFANTTQSDQFDSLVHQHV
ncbi:uncharacterized protein G2W53_003809 [Senna tora]|uniref:Uncharacterized protein n=1 Tax=Senna tora TaxID=362788 RepID=A0A835CG33_9FABA|nr:uncharacterized protein G2W53_003809 [Senna tora]